MFGKGKSELMEALASLDKSTEVDFLSQTSNKIFISAKKDRNGKIKGWQIENQMKDDSKEKIIRKGKNLPMLEKALNELDKTLSYNEELNILCYCSTSSTKTEDGKIKSKWFNIEPALPFEMKNGNIQFQFIDLELSKEEYKVMLETRLALYNEFDGSIYPIRKQAIQSVGRLLDSVASFKNLSSIPLGSALVIAEKLANSNSRHLHFIYRNKTKKIKPLIGIAGCQYQKISQSEFFESIFNEISKSYIYTVNKWTITDEYTEVNVSLNVFNPDYEIIAVIKTSDIPGIAMSVITYAKFGDALVFIKRNKMKHNLQFDFDLIHMLFDGMKESIELFACKYEALRNVLVPFNKSYILGTKKYIGKKRYEGIKKYTKNIEYGDLLYKDILQNTFFCLKEKQAFELSVYYSNLLDKMLAFSNIKEA